MTRLKTTSIYVLSVLSFICCCFLGLGISLALPAYIMANNKLKYGEENPDLYEPDSVNDMRTARTVALIALIINGLYLLYSAYSLATTDWDVFWEKYQEALEQYQ